MMNDCIFCKIANGQIPCSKVYETDQVLAFDDIHPMAPVHVIVIPKAHIPTLMDLKGERLNVMTALVQAVQDVAKIKKIDEKGFRTVINCKEEGGQVIFHLHLHVLGGNKLKDALN
jgi:histidine triad (HIT) family protein